MNGLHIDVNRAFRTHQRRTELAEAIYEADLGIRGTHWLEWRGALDLESDAGRFAAARSIIAFANRDPAAAARDCRGQAYLLVGVEPGRVKGVGVQDCAVTREQLGRFVDGPYWEIDYVDVGPTIVMVITVAAPQRGDPIHSLAADYEGIRSGTVFYRGAAGSAPATHRELGELQDRLMRVSPSVAGASESPRGRHNPRRRAEYCSAGGD